MTLSKRRVSPWFLLALLLLLGLLAFRIVAIFLSGLLPNDPSRSGQERPHDNNG